MLLCQRVIFKMATGGLEFTAGPARCFVRAMQQSGASSMESLVGITGSNAPGNEDALRSEGLNSNGHVSPVTDVTAKSGEPKLILRDRFMLAALAKTLQSAREAVAKDAAVATAAANDQVVDKGPDIPALAEAAGYGDWPRSLWPTRFMLSTLKKATRGDKGSPIPWADPKAAPWFDPTWSKGEAYLEDDELRALGERAEEFGFGSVDLVARNVFTAALKAQRMQIRHTQWSAAMARIMHAMAVQVPREMT